MVARGDSATLRQNSIASVASDFSGIETAVKDNQANFSGVQANPRSPFLLKVEGAAPLARAEFLCGVFGRSGQTSDSAVFAIPNLPPGSYAIVILDVPTAKQPDTVSFVLQQEGKTGKLAACTSRNLKSRGMMRTGLPIALAPSKLRAKIAMPGSTTSKHAIWPSRCDSCTRS